MCENVRGRRPRCNPPGAPVQPPRGVCSLSSRSGEPPAMARWTRSPISAARSSRWGAGAWAERDRAETPKLVDCSLKAEAAVGRVLMFFVEFNEVYEIPRTSFDMFFFWRGSQGFGSFFRSGFGPFWQFLAPRFPPEHPRHSDKF